MSASEWLSMRTSPSPTRPSSVCTSTNVRFRHAVPRMYVLTSLIFTMRVLYDDQHGLHEHPCRHTFKFKWLEAVAYHGPRGLDPEVQRMADHAIGLLQAAQAADGYLDSFYQRPAAS